MACNRDIFTFFYSTATFVCRNCGYSDDSGGGGISNSSSSGGSGGGGSINDGHCGV
jgi:hypothetical protein